MFVAYGIVPLVALLGLGKSPRLIRSMFWLMIPVWCVVHLLGGALIETALFLVPFIMVVVPAALFAVRGEALEEGAPSLQADPPS
jgi:hypothetical protein